MKIIKFKPKKEGEDYHKQLIRLHDRMIGKGATGETHMIGMTYEDQYKVKPVPHHLMSNAMVGIFKIKRI